MKRIFRFKFFLPMLILIFCFIGAARAATVNATTCGSTDIQNAINSASSGDTVNVPAGSCAWTGTVNVNKKVILKGAGIGLTIISNGYITMLTSPGPRVTGFQFNGVNDPTILVDGLDWRIDNCEFNNTGGTFVMAILFSPQDNPAIVPRGVIDHDTFLDSRIDIFGTAYIIADDGGANQNRLWNYDATLGKENSVFVEDSNFTGSHLINVIDTAYGGRYVFRHNIYNCTIPGGTEYMVEVHSTREDNRGGRVWEIYNNTIINSAGVSMWGGIGYVRDGTGVIFDNTVIGTTQYGLLLNNERDTTDSGYDGAGPSYLCNGSSVWDQNTPGQGGWRCRDQVGSGGDATLWTYGGAYNQISQPAYFWNNTPDTIDVTWQSSVNHIVNGRDYYNDVQKPGYVPYYYPYPYVSGIPGVDLNYPINGNSTNQTSITFNISAIDATSLANVTLYGNWTGTWSANQTIALTGPDNATTFTKTLANGTYIWNVYVCNSQGNCTFGVQNYTLIVGSGLSGITAASCNLTDVNSSINNASNGDTVNIPAGNCTWGSDLTITKAITLQGAGVGNTNITGNIDYTMPTPNLYTFFRLTGFTIKGKIILSADHAQKNVGRIRIDNNSIMGSGFSGGGVGSIIQTDGQIYGVIDHNKIVMGDSFYIFGADSYSWTYVTFAYGTGATLFIEDNDITYNSDSDSLFQDSGVGMMFVLRYNNYTYTNPPSDSSVAYWWDMHGNQGTGSNWGTMGAEIYGNRLVSTTVSNLEMVDHRGGELMLFWNKAVSGISSVYEQTREECDDCLNGQSPCVGPSGEPMHVSNSYYWNNRYGTNLVTDNTIVNGGRVDCVAPTYNISFGVDIFNDNGNGVTYGILASLPATCSIGQGYWATNQQTSIVNDSNTGTNPSNPISGSLYKCISTNKWIQYYTPYYYPNPLVSGIPGVDLIYPVNGNSTNQNSITFNVSAIDATSLANVTLYGNWTGTWSTNQTIALTGPENATTFTKTLSNGTYIWNAYVCDNQNNCRFGTMNYTLIIGNGISGITAASCNLTDVNSSINNASNGDTVNIPAGNCNWGANTLTITKSITLQGTGENLTNITGTYNDALSCLISISLSSDVPVRITNIHFIYSTNNPGGRSVCISGKTDGSFAYTKIRVDNNEFEKGARAVFSSGWVEGVIDHNLFYDNNIGIGISGEDNASWNRKIVAGTSHAVFIENNTFIIDNNVDTEPNEEIYPQEGARVVTRYNLFDSTAYTNGNSFFHTSHGNQDYYTGGTVNFRGQPLIEIYQNRINIYKSYDYQLVSRGSSWIAYNNNITCQTGSCLGIKLTEEEDWQGSFFSPLRTVWPAQDQIINSFFWNNTINGAAITSVNLLTSNDSTFIQKDRDYYMHPPNSSGGNEYYTGARQGGSQSPPTQNDTGSMNFTSSGAQAYYPYVTYYPVHPLESGLPGVNLDFPVKSFSTSYNTTNTTVTFNVSVIDKSALASVTLYGNWTGSWQANQTITLTGTSNSTSFTKTLVNGTYIWNAYVCNSQGNCAFGVQNYTLTVGSGVSNGTSDTTYPAFSSYYDNNGTQAGMETGAFNVTTLTNVNGTGLFNVTIANTNGTVILEINGTNVTAQNLADGVYNASYSFSSNGTYSYHWDSWGNGNSTNFNVSNTRSFTVNNPDIVSVLTGRIINWTGSVGIPGGIPNRTIICATINSSAYGNGTIDATTAIQTALNSCPSNQVVYLTTGGFLIDGSIQIPSNVTLRGAGASQTILYGEGSGSDLISFGSSATYSSDLDLVTSGAVAGSKNIIVNSSTGISVGSYLIINELNDPSFVTILGNEGTCTWCDGWWNGTRALGQMVEVTGVSGTNISINPPIYFNYSNSLSPAVTRFNAVAKYAGLENLQLYMNNTGYIANVRMDGSAYCWIKGIESNYADGNHVEASTSYRGEIRDSYFHDAFLHTPGTTDATIMLGLKTSGFLIENNILRRLHTSIMLNWGAAGNVIAYNYLDGDFDQYSPNVLMMDMSMHGAHPMFNLWEGNVFSTLNPDGTWGSASDNTAFRNWVRGTTQICDPLSGRGQISSCWWAIQSNRAMDITFADFYFNLIGNVVGSSQMLNLTFYNNNVTPMGMQSLIVWPATRSWDAVAYSYSFGYGGSGAGDCGTNNCSNSSYTTSILHGNYDYIAGNTNWSSSIPTQSLPSSLYLTAKPLWFENISYPPIGPDVNNGNDSSGHVNYIPAEVCYTNAMQNGTLAFDPSVCYYGAVSGGNPNVTTTLNSPANAYSTNNQTVTFNCSALDNNGNSLTNITLYGNWTGIWGANETKTATGINNSITFTKTLPNGNYQWNCLAFDNATSSDWGDSNYTLTVDTINPNIQIIYPSNNSNLSINTVNVNYTVSDNIGISSCWYSNDTYSINTSLANCGNLTTIIWSNGGHNVTIWANDSAGNMNYSRITFNVSVFIDTIYPTFSSYYDNNGTLNGTGTGLFNVTLSNTNGTVFLEINGVNVTAKNLSDGFYNASYVFSSGGNYKYYWISYGSGNSTNFNVSNTRSYNVNSTSDTTPPTINFVAPTPSNGTTQSAASVYVNISTSDANNYSAWIDWNRSLIGYWAMDYYNASGIYDNSTYGNFGNFMEGIGTGNITTAIRGKGLYLNGSYWVNTTNSFNLSANFTISAWVRRSNNILGYGGAIVYQGGSTTSSNCYGTRWIYNGDDWYTDNALGWQAAQTPLTNDIWYYVTAVGNGTNITFYENGVAAGSITEYKNITWNSCPIYINSPTSQSSSLNGTIDELMIFSRSLSSQEIKALYNAATNQYYNNFTNLANGNYTYKAYAIDAAGNFNSTDTRSVIIGSGDTTPPNINIIYPLNNTNTTNTQINVNYTVSDNVAVGSCWYSNTSGAINYTLASCANITGVTWSQGTNNVTIWVNDASGNQNSSRVRFTVDNIVPNINILYPSNNTNTSNANINVNYTASDNVGLSKCWYSNDTGVHNTTLASCGTNITGVTWSQGINNITIWVNDTSGNQNSSRVSFFVDTIPPNIQIVYPVNNTNTTNTQINVNYTVSDSGTGVFSCWYSASWTPFGGGSGGGGMGLPGSCANITNQTWSQGINTVVIYVNDSVGNLNHSSVIFGLDTTPPSFTNLANQTINTNQSLNYNINAADAGVGLGTFAINWTTTFSIAVGTGVLTNISGLSLGIYLINVSVNDTLGNMNSSILLINVTNIPDTTNPQISINYPSNNTNTSNVNLNVNYTVFDNFGISSCWYSNDSMGVNYSLGGNGNCVNIANITWSSGKHNVIVYVNDTSNNLNWSRISFFVDSNYPQFSNYWDNNASLIGNGTGLFNVTLSNTNGTVFLEINGVNVTAKNVTDNIFNATYTFSSSGTYSYKWYSWGNGTSNNLNISNTISYTVNGTSDITPPNISGIGSSVTSSTATIIWVTDENSNSTVYYGITTSTTSNSNDASLTQAHSITLNGLVASTPYYYNVSSCDSFGNCNTSQQNTFITSSAGGTGGSGSGGSSGGSGGGISTTNNTSGVYSGNNFVNRSIFSVFIPLITIQNTTVTNSFNPDIIGINEIYLGVNNETRNVNITIIGYSQNPTQFSDSNKVYVYLDFETWNITSKLNTASMKIQVAKNWTTAKNIGKGDVALFHFNESSRIWNELNTDYLREDNNYYYYQSSVGSFSYFYIGEKTGNAVIGIGKIENSIITIFNNVVSYSYFIWILISIVGLIILILLLRAISRRIKSQKPYKREERLASKYGVEKPIVRPVERPKPVVEKQEITRPIIARPVVAKPVVSSPIVERKIVEPPKVIERKYVGSPEEESLKRKIDEIEKKQRMKVLDEMKKKVRDMGK